MIVLRPEGDRGVERPILDELINSSGERNTWRVVLKVRSSSELQ